MTTTQVTFDDDTQLDFDCRGECFLEPVPDGAQPPRIILVSINRDGQVGTVCTTCVVDIIQHPEIYPGVALYGTHILSDRLQAELFPDDFTD